MSKYNAADVQRQVAFIQKHSHLTQSQIAKQLGTSQPYISQLCLKHNLPTVGRATKDPDPQNVEFTNSAMAGKQSLSLLRKPWTREGLGV